MTEYAAACQEAGPNLLSIKVEMKNTGARTVRLISEEYWGNHLEAPDRQKNKADLVDF